MSRRRIKNFIETTTITLFFVSMFAWMFIDWLVVGY